MTSGRPPPRHGTSGARCCAPGLARPRRSCSTWPRSGPAIGCSTSPPALATRACRPPIASGRAAMCWRPTSPPTSSTSPPRMRARAGHRNIETKVLDGENLDVPAGSFDAVISRVGLIYFPDQQKALAGMKRALKPGGRVAAIVYSTADNNKFFSIPVSIIRRRAKLPPPLPGQPGPFSLGGPGVLEETFARRASATSRSAPCRRRFGSNGGRMRALREGIVRRAAPDAGRPRRSRARSGVAGDRAGAARVREGRRFRGAVRDARRRRQPSDGGPYQLQSSFTSATAPRVILTSSLGLVLNT